MSLYSKYVLPNLINIACKQSSLSKQREKVIPLAEGNTLSGIILTLCTIASLLISNSFFGLIFNSRNCRNSF